MNQPPSALLPNGLKDLLPPEAEEEARLIESLMAEFTSFGYRRVKPPMAEFEDSLLAPGPGQALSRNTFRLMDPVSQRMMGIRADTTAQIARIAESRLAKDKRPLRLSYAADVMRVNGTQLRPERQFCQVGCEFIGASDIQDDVEIALLAAKSLSAAGVQNLSIDLTVPTLVNYVYVSSGTSEEGQAALDESLTRRDRDALEGSKNKAAKLLAELLDCSGEAQSAIAKLRKVKLPKEAKQDVESLDKVYAELTKAMEVYGLEGIKLTIDPVERRGFEYQTGVSFTLFAAGVRGELGRGGRYNVRNGGADSESATGFTLYMDSVRRALPEQPDRDSVAVPSNARWDDIKALQDEGWSVSRGGDEKTHTHIYSNGKIEKREG